MKEEHTVLKALNEVIEELKGLTKFKRFASIEGIENIDLLKLQIDNLQPQTIEQIDKNGIKGYELNGYYGEKAMPTMILNNKHITASTDKLKKVIEDNLLLELGKGNSKMNSLITETTKDLNPNFVPSSAITKNIYFRENDTHLDPRSTNGNTHISGRTSSSLEISGEDKNKIIDFIVEKLAGSEREKFIDFIIQDKPEFEGKTKELLKDSIVNNLGSVTNKLNVPYYDTLSEFKKDNKKDNGVSLSN